MGIKEYSRLMTAYSVKVVKEFNFFAKMYLVAEN